MEYALGAIFSVSALTLLAAHGALLVEVARTRRLGVFFAALLIPPVAPLTCAEGKRAWVVKTWFVAFVTYAIALIVARYVR